MPIYIIDGQEYEVNDSNRQIFESAFGDLEQYKVAGPENFQQDPADAETIVGSENNMVSNSDDGLLVSPEQDRRYVEYKQNGKAVRLYEDEYLNKYAGNQSNQVGGSSSYKYPDNFDAYIKQQRGRLGEIKLDTFESDLQEIENVNQDLDEVVVTGELSHEQLVNRQIAEDLMENNRSITEDNLKNEIGNAYFLEPYLTRDSGQSTTSIGYAGNSKFVPNFNSDEEYQKYLAEEMGPEKYAIYSKANKAAIADGVILNDDNIDQYFDLDDVPNNVKGPIVQEKRDKESEVYLRNLDLTPEEQLEVEKFTGSDNVKNEKAIAVYEEKIRAQQYRKWAEDQNMRNKLQVGPYVQIDWSLTQPNYEKALDQVQEDEAGRLDKEVRRIESLSNQYENDLKDFRELEEQIKSYTGPLNLDEFNSPEEVKFRNSLISEYNEYALKLNAQASYLKANSEQLMNDMEIYGVTASTDKALVKSYSTLDLLGNTWDSAIVGSAYMLGGAVSSLWDGGSGYEAAIDYNQELQNYSQKYLPQALTSDDSSTGWQYFGDMMVRNSPSIVIAAGTVATGGVAGLAGAGARGTMAAVNAYSRAAASTFFVMESGGQLSNLEIQQREAPKIIAQLKELKQLKISEGAAQKEIDEINSQIQEQESILDLSYFQKGLNSTFYGGTAAFAERFGTLGFIKNFQKYSKAIGGNQFRKAFGERLGTNISKATGNVFALGGIGPAIELLEEGGTLMMQNISDNVVFSPENSKSLFEGLDGEFIRNVYTSSLAIGGSGASQNLMAFANNEIKTRLQIAKETDLKNKLVDIQTRYNALSDKRTKEGADLRRQQNQTINELAQVNTDIAMNLSVSRGMTPSEIETIFENNAKIRRLQYDANNLPVTDFGKRDRREYERLKNEAQDLYDANQKVLGRYDKELEKQSKKASNPLEYRFNRRRFDTFKEIAKSNKKINIVETNSKEEYEKFLKDNNIRLTKNNAYGKGTAAFINNTLLINNEIADAVMFKGGLNAEIASVSPLHELGHQQVKAQGIIKNNKLVSDNAADVIASLQQDFKTRFDQGKISEDAYNNFQDRLKKYTKRNKGQVDADELIQLVSDFTALGILPKSSYGKLWGAKSLINNILALANKYGKGNNSYKDFFQVNSADDVYNFIANFQNKAAKFKFQAPPEEKKDKKLKPSLVVDKVKDRLDAIPLDKLNSNAAQNIIGNELFGMVETQIRNRFNLQPDQIEELTADVIARINVAQENTKWDGRGSLYGFLNGRIAKRILDALRANPDYLDVVTKQELTGLEKASQVVQEESKVTKEKPKFKTLAESNVLPADQIASVKKKLITTIRVLKSRQDAKRSLNRTVTPVIAEIRKEMGKQADIEFKKRLGPKKDGILKRNYLRFKKPILENMTTTWLMTAMPFAIQKQVDGKFTSDWQGKKIDRETVDTDKAGRTSGADIVRRLPNIADRVSDEQFLSYMFKDGELIRGRKESLSKAMAEELAFDILNQELNDPDSPLRVAFEQNQQNLGVALAENYVQELQKDIERGNVKFSLSGLNPSEFQSFRGKLPEIAGALATLDGDYGRTPTVIKNVLKTIFDDEFTNKQYDGIAKQFFNRLKSVNTAKDKDGKFINKPGTFVKPSQEEVIDYVFAVALDQDTNEVILQYTGADRNSFAKDASINVFNDSQNVQDARDSVEASLIKAIKNGDLTVAEVVAFFSGTFANSGKIGVYTNTEGSLSFRSDLYAKKEQWLPALKRIIPNLKDVTKSKITLTNGKVIARDIKPSSSVEASMLDGTFDTAKNKKDAKAAFKFTKAIIEGIKKDNPVIQSMILASLNSGTNTALRAAAPVAWNTVGFDSKITSDYRYEHMTPARKVLYDLYRGIVLNQDVDIAAVQEDYQVAIIPKIMDDVIGDVNLGRFTIPNHIPGVTPNYERYYNILTRGRVQFAIRSLENPNLVIGENYAEYFKQKDKPNIKLEAPQEIERNINFEKAFKLSINLDYGKNPKGITVLDFDDTVAISDSKVIVIMPTNLEGLSKIDRLIKENRLYGPGNRILNNRFEQELLARKKKIKELDTNNSADELRALYKKAKGENKENIKLAIQEKFKALGEDVVADSQIDIYTGEVMKITPAEFAAKSTDLEAQGAKFDFSEFNKVVKGRKGPLFDLALKRQEKFGNDNIFILTARPQASARSIQRFAKGLGLNLKLKNITGLEDGSPQAKADWIVGKVNEGFNDFYFADDALKNVKAVQEALDLFDVKSDVQQAKMKFSLNLNKDINKMIERNKGIKAEATFSKILARRKGAKKGRFKFFLPFGAEDFRGLTSYTLAGKGKQGEADQKFFEDHLVNPYIRGVAAMERARRALKIDYAGLLKMYPEIRKKLNKKYPGMQYTRDQMIRIYLYDKSGFEIPGLSQTDLKKIKSLINKDADMKAFAEGLQLITKKDKFAEPSEFWDTNNILMDLNALTDNVSRKEYLAEFIENVDAVFDEATLNKLEAVYGTNYVDALKNIISRMKSGINRPSQPGKYERKWLNWVNNSVGTIMFFNRRSAILQMLSFANFVNWSDNNPIKAAAAFANQPEYWKAWSEIFNSPKLKERRGGLKSDIQEQEIANQARNAKDKASAVTAYLLKKGFLPTQIADSVAIATGGATFLINRTKTYQKQGMSYEDARAKAFEDFSKISDETQQSGDPMLISAQQSSHLGRLILAFQNTPMQYNRLIKKAAQDLINGRGDAKTNISKIAYYGFVQNLIFNSLQQALFAMIPGFDDGEDEEDDDAALTKKQTKILNGMADSLLRGSGLYGAIVSTLKNSIMRYKQERDEGFTGDQAQTLIELANISPPIGSKLRKVYGAILGDQYDRGVIKERGFDVIDGQGRLNLSPAYNIVGNLTSAFLNLPLDRAIVEIEGISEMLDDRNSVYQRIALGLGWRTWDVGAENEEEKHIKLYLDVIKEEENKKKAAHKRLVAKQEEFDRLAAMTPEEKAAYIAEEKRKNSERAKKAAKTRAENQRIKDSILYSN